MVAAVSTSAATVAFDLEALGAQDRLAEAPPVAARLTKLIQEILATDATTVRQVVIWHERCIPPSALTTP